MRSYAVQHTTPVPTRLMPLTPPRLLQGRPELALPHLDVPSIAALRWDRLAAHGYRGVVFDKDNTLTLPYDLSVHDSVASSLRECLQCFGDNVVIFSNSAGAQPPPAALGGCHMIELS